MSEVWEVELSETAMLFLEIIFHLLIMRCLFQLKMQHLAYLPDMQKGLERKRNIGLSLTFENWLGTNLGQIRNYIYYEESVVDKFKSNLLLLIFWLHIINYNS